jgi:hypothetical protein
MRDLHLELDVPLLALLHLGLEAGKQVAVGQIRAFQLSKLSIKCSRRAQASVPLFLEQSGLGRQLARGGFPLGQFVTVRSPYLLRPRQLSAQVLVPLLCQGRP